MLVYHSPYSGFPDPASALSRPRANRSRQRQKASPCRHGRSLREGCPTLSIRTSFNTFLLGGRAYPDRDMLGQTSLKAPVALSSEAPYICMCIYIYIYIYIHIYIYITSIYIYITYILCIYIYIYTHIHIYIYIYTHTHTYTYVYI